MSRRDIRLYYCSKHLGYFLCPVCGKPHNVQLSLVKGDMLWGSCPVERLYAEFNVVERITGDRVPPLVRATAIMP
jgi:hypothetical protein